MDSSKERWEALSPYQRELVVSTLLLQRMKTLQLAHESQTSGLAALAERYDSNAEAFATAIDLLRDATLVDVALAV